MTRVLPWVAASLVLIWCVVLFFFDPEQNQHYLPCPFHWLTGWYCPGCGAQRAVHDLLYGRLAEAFSHNAALVCTPPLLAAQWALGRWRGTSPVHGNRVVFIWVGALILWGIARNLPGLEALAP